MLSETVTIKNKLGLHARASAKLVATANRFSSTIELIKDNKRANAKSIMAVMMLAAPKGSDIEIIAEGEDEAAAVKQLIELVENRFDEAE